jgi:hypothetical protein
MFDNTWTIPESQFPKSGSTAEQLKFFLNYAVLAPSELNTQPWLFNIQDDTVELWADRSRTLPITDPCQRELIISCGTALFNLRLAMHYFGYRDRTLPFPEPNQSDLLAHIQMGEPIPEIEQTGANYVLLHAILKRHTNRRHYLTSDLDRSLFRLLEEKAVQEGAWLYRVEGELARKQLADLVIQANRLQIADPDFWHELSTWHRLKEQQSGNGIPSYAQHAYLRSSLMSLTASSSPPTIEQIEAICQSDYRLVQEASAVAVLGTAQDTPAEWLIAGQALESVLLHAQVLGLSVSFFNQPIEVAQCRTQLSQILEQEGSPQMVLRLGFSADVNPTPRRSVNDVLLGTTATQQ